MTKNAPNREAQHVYAVLRLDLPRDEEQDSLRTRPGDFITVKELLPTEDEAVREVARLTALNAHTGAIYFVQIGRLYLEGRNLREE